MSKKESKKETKKETPSKKVKLDKEEREYKKYFLQDLKGETTKDELCFKGGYYGIFENNSNSRCIWREY